MSRDKELPPIREIAERLRNGEDFERFCEWYDVTPSMMANRLHYAGYSISGGPLHDRQGWVGPLTTAVGNCITGNGGGDYKGLPIEPVLHSRRVRRVFVGLDWSTSPASGPRWYES